MLVTTPGGGEVWPQGQTFPIRWRSDQSTANALSFNGSSQYVSIANSPSLYSASLTVEGWFNFASTSGTSDSFQHSGSASSSSSFAVTYSGGYLLRVDRRPERKRLGHLVSMDADVRHLALTIAFTFDSASETETLYLDGVAVASGAANQAIGYDAQPGDPRSPIAEFGIGNWFSGTIDEVRFWNSAVSQATIQANMNRTLTGTESGLDAYYTFDTITNGTAADLTGRGNTAILGNGSPASEPASVPSHAPLGDVALI